MKASVLQPDKMIRWLNNEYYVLYLLSKKLVVPSVTKALSWKRRKGPIKSHSQQFWKNWNLYCHYCSKAQPVIYFKTAKSNWKPPIEMVSFFRTSHCYCRWSFHRRVWNFHGLLLATRYKFVQVVIHMQKQNVWKDRWNILLKCGVSCKHENWSGDRRFPKRAYQEYCFNIFSEYIDAIHLQRKKNDRVRCTTQAASKLTAITKGIDRFTDEASPNTGRASKTRRWQKINIYIVVKGAFIFISRKTKKRRRR